MKLKKYVNELNHHLPAELAFLSLPLLPRRDLDFAGASNEKGNSVVENESDRGSGIWNWKFYIHIMHGVSKPRNI
jgi:hypothetical protein